MWKKFCTQALQLKIIQLEVAKECTEPFPILINKIRLWWNLYLCFKFNVLLVFDFINLKCIFVVVVIYKETTPQATQPWLLAGRGVDW